MKAFTSPRTLRSIGFTFSLLVVLSTVGLLAAPQHAFGRTRTPTELGDPDVDTGPSTGPSKGGTANAAGLSLSPSSGVVRTGRMVERGVLTLIVIRGVWAILFNWRGVPTL